ncbi:MAG: hypothetical protein NTX61_11780 [Bacteroidetes bacterium]|nr:hypothetical protein [Bacteroidota bacterium]
MQSNENTESLIQFCQENQRVCPMPIYWNDLWGKLKNRKRVGNGWEPSAPLILAGWWEASDLSKRLRLIDHIKWAEKQGQLEEISNFLKSLKEEEWYHFGG